MKHKHHIIPRHIGGSDNPENLIELTIEEHANEHKKLFDKCGRWQDELAWKGLSGMIGKEEIIERLQLEGASVGGKEAQKTLRKLKICSFYNEELRQKAATNGRMKCKENGSGFYESDLQSELGKRGGPQNKGFVWINDGIFSIKYSVKKQSNKSIDVFLEENPQYTLGRIQPASIVICPHCGIEGFKSAMVLHHFDKCSKITGKKRTFTIKKSICPHCNFEGAGGSMKRWHFNNCKIKDSDENSQKREK